MRFSYFGMKFIITFTILCCIIQPGCKKNNPIESYYVDTPDSSDNNAIAIYFLKDSTQTIKDILNANLEELVLEDKPWLTQQDIEFYDWSSHCIYLKEDKTYFFPGSIKLFYQFPRTWTDKVLIFTINKHICYVGYFLTESSLYEYQFPYIDSYDVGMYPKDIIHSQWVFLYKEDTRNNEEIKGKLGENMLLHLGINIQLGDTLWVKNADTATVKYKIIIKNNDSDNLLVFDPNNTLAELFNYFNNGPEFKNINTQKTYKSDYKMIKGPLKLTDWDPSWFTPIESGKSIERNIELKGYPPFIDGEYLIQLSFTGPVSISKEKRIYNNNRYWIGKTQSDVKQIQINIKNEMAKVKWKAIIIK